MIFSTIGLSVPTTVPIHIVTRESSLILQDLLAERRCALSEKKHADEGKADWGHPCQCQVGEQGFILSFTINSS